MRNATEAGKGMVERLRPAGIGLGLLLAGFLLGWVSQVGDKRALDRALTETRLEADTLVQTVARYRLHTRVGAALAEADRGNYERARQLMSSFFTDIEDRSAAADPALLQVLESATAQRDELITLLSRAAPESRQHLAILYTRLFAALDPLGRDAATAVTPPPADTTSRS